MKSLLTENLSACFLSQDEPATLSTLNEKELRELLDEAITYKCPKDREGKSNLFKVRKRENIIEVKKSGSVGLWSFLMIKEKSLEFSHFCNQVAIKA